MTHEAKEKETGIYRDRARNRDTILNIEEKEKAKKKKKNKKKKMEKKKNRRMR